MEFLGAISLGQGVSDTIQKGISDLDDPDCWACGYCDSEMSVYQIGMFGALVSTAIFLLISSFSKMPVSATHAVVGGVVGMTMAGVGTPCINWSYDGLGGIFASWVISPVFSGLIGSITFIFTDKIIFQSQSPRSRALMALPAFITLVTFVMTFLICLKSPVTKNQESWIHFAVASGFAFFASVLSTTLLLPWAHRNLPSRSSPPLLQSTPTLSTDCLVVQTDKLRTSEFSDGSLGAEGIDAFAPSGTSSSSSAAVPTEDIQDALFCFKLLLLCNAALESFAHGANDTANCTAPFSAVYLIYQRGLDSCHEPESGEWIMALAGFFVALGVITFGKNVIETIGKQLTLVDFHRGFCIEFSSCVTVVLATMMGLPVSTTHCQIGSVVFVGWVSSGAEHVAWELVGKIFLTWIITLPFSGGLSSALLLAIKPSLRH
jgi:solute carrier family 20 (sodium-dependent phosphate transporter)